MREPSAPFLRSVARRWGRTVAAIMLAGGAAGCQTASKGPQPTQAPAPPPAPASQFAESLVMPGPEVMAWEQSPTGMLDIDRFEFARRDARLNPQVRRPLLADQLWLEPAAPMERPVRFRRWQQR